MADIFETTEKSNKTDWHSNKEMNPIVNSPITDEGLLESDNQNGEKSWRKEKKSDNCSTKEQIFHPLDKIF